jgi:mannose-6-phosphate isomerase-like protein (cupin superfamily)
MTTPPVLKHLSELRKFTISAGDTVKLAYLAGPPDGAMASVFFEVWEPLGAQPDNSHPESTEIFVVLAGHGRAYSDEHVADLEPGDVLILPEGSVHRIENTSPTERMYTITVMSEDLGAMPGGFAQLVRNGIPEELDGTDLATLFR